MADEPKERYLHLPLQRLEPVNPRRRGGGGPRVAPPADPPAHAFNLARQLESAVRGLKTQEQGFDPRLLLKLSYQVLDPQNLEAIPGIQVVSQEGKEVVVLFATEQALQDFRSRLDQIRAGERAVRQDVLFAIKGIDGWSPQDRTGPSLSREGFPATGRFTVDAELWPLDQGRQRELMLEHFGTWCREKGLEIVDSVNQETIILYRLRVEASGLQILLLNRDVRLVDLPPRFQLDIGVVRRPLSSINTPSSPPDSAAAISILDSGLATNHPLIGPAVGDAQSFIAGYGAEDGCGHGTMVTGVALYGDVWECASSGVFVPELRVFSGRIMDDTGANDTGFVENHVVEAVRYFTQNYGCKVFNLSFGDLRKPFVGGHVRGLAAVLDSLAREYRVLFVVSAGNLPEDSPISWRRDYPQYFSREPTSIIDPAPAINALTVGSLARNEVPRMSRRFNDPAYQPIARLDQPSPFTRTGPGPCGALKPEVVDYGGNLYVDLRDMSGRAKGGNELGELSTSHAFASGNLFSVQSGTSYAAARVSHLAARLLNEYPEASADLLRALVVAHSHHPVPSQMLFNGDGELAYRLVGYGKPDAEAAATSSERRVTLLSQEAIGEDSHHFYEIPLPDDFLGPPARRSRRITVALAYTPRVRRTRIDYKASRVSFRVVRAPDLDTVVRVFRQTPPDEREDRIPETGRFRPGPLIRGKGTVQAATWDIEQIDGRWGTDSLFVVVTHMPASWASGIGGSEPYSVVVVVEDRSTHEVRLYSKIRQALQLRVRVQS